MAPPQKAELCYSRAHTGEILRYIYFIAAVFTGAELGMQTRCLSTDEWMEKEEAVCRHSGILHSLKKNEIVWFAEKKHKQMEITICRKISWLRETNITQILYWHRKSPVGTGHGLRNQKPVEWQELETGKNGRWMLTVEGHNRLTCVGISLCETHHCVMYIIIPKRND